MGSSLGSALSVTFPRFPLVTRQRLLSLFSLLLLSERAIRDFASFPPLHGCHRGQSSNVDHMLSLPLLAHSSSSSISLFLASSYCPLFITQDTQSRMEDISILNSSSLLSAGSLPFSLYIPPDMPVSLPALSPQFVYLVQFCPSVLLKENGRKMVVLHFRMVVRRPMGVLSLAILVLGLWSGAETKRAPLGEQICTNPFFIQTARECACKVIHHWGEWYLHNQ